MDVIYRDIEHVNDLIKEDNKLLIAVYTNTLAFDLSELSTVELNSLKRKCEINAISKDLIDLIQQAIECKI